MIMKLVRAPPSDECGRPRRLPRWRESILTTVDHRHMLTEQCCYSLREGRSAGRPSSHAACAPASCTFLRFFFGATTSVELRRFKPSDGAGCIFHLCPLPGPGLV